MEALLPTRRRLLLGRGVLSAGFFASWGTFASHSRFPAPLALLLASTHAETDLNRAAISTIIFFSPYCADCDIVKQVKRSAAGRLVEAWICSRWSSNQSLFSRTLESTGRGASEASQQTDAFDDVENSMLSLASLTVFSRALLNED